MLVVRPVAEADWEQVVDLAEMASCGLTSLPPDPDLLRKKIRQSGRSLAYLPERPGGDSFLFVLEDTRSGELLGTTGLYAKVGGFEPFYTYAVRDLELHSASLGIRKSIQYLELCRDHSGPSEIGTLFLKPKARRGGNGRLLSLCRFLFMAEYRACFEDTVLAELRGYYLEDEVSPFWEAVGRHFFGVDLRKADLMSAKDKAFIAELMPQHPIYIPLLPQAARQVIGRVNTETEPALHLLAQEGFARNGHVDIFEAGPVLSCPTDRIRTLAHSRWANCRLAEAVPDTPPMLIATAGPPTAWRCLIGAVGQDGDTAAIAAATADALGLQAGDPLRYAPLRPPKAPG